MVLWPDGLAIIEQKETRETKVRNLFLKIGMLLFSMKNKAEGWLDQFRMVGTAHPTGIAHTSGPPYSLIGCNLISRRSVTAAFGLEVARTSIPKRPRDSNRRRPSLRG